MREGAPRTHARWYCIDSFWPSSASYGLTMVKLNALLCLAALASLWCVDASKDVARLQIGIKVCFQKELQICTPGGPAA